jgi:hypothetical protein
LHVVPTPRDGQRQRRKEVAGVPMVDWPRRGLRRHETMPRARTATDGTVLGKFAILAFALCLRMPASAAEVAGVTLSDEVSVGGHALVLNGAGIRAILLFKIYVGSLYLPQKAGDLAAVLAHSPRRIQMNALRDLTSGQLVDALVGGLAANNSPDEMAAVKAGTDQMVRILTAFKDVDVKATDVLTMDFVEGTTRVALNGEVRGVIPGAEFNRALTRIWLGDKPPAESLKKAMLGR